MLKMNKIIKKLNKRTVSHSKKQPRGLALCQPILVSIFLVSIDINLIMKFVRR